MGRSPLKRAARLINHSAALASGVCIAVLVVGCNRLPAPEPDLTITSEVSPQPVRVGPSTIRLKLSDARGQAVSGARVALEGNMTHPGMRAVFSQAREVGPGQYQAPIELSMAGDWVVMVHVTLSTGLKVERQFEIRGVLPG